MIKPAQLGDRLMPASNMVNAFAIKGVFKNTVLDYSKLVSGNFAFSNFSGASLRHVNLRSANVIEAKFVNADLTNASLKGTIAIRANFVGAKLRNSELIGGLYKSAIFSGADFTDSIIRDPLMILSRPNLDPEKLILVMLYLGLQDFSIRVNKL